MGQSVDGAILSLDAQYGDDAAAIMPASFTIRLYDGDPRDTGEELDSGTDSPGYAALTGVTNNSTNFPAADVDGTKTTAQFTVCTATGTWDAAPAYAALCDGTTVLRVVPLGSGPVPVDTDDVNVTLVLVGEAGL